jgi:hypothetical protein
MKGTQRDGKCHNCGRTDHWARDCCQPKELANLTQAEEDEEPTLLTAMVEEIQDAPTRPLAVKSTPVEQQQVYLDGTKGQAFLDTTSSADDHLECWYLNMGAMNQMMSRSEVFSELDQAVHSAVKFGDGSIINICE